MACLPLTQALPEEPRIADSTKDGKIGFLVHNNDRHEIITGETKIGRDASICSIVFDNETLSKLHAVIESAGPEDTFIYDVGSTNKTKIGKLVLKPHCRYKINNGDSITLGSVTAKFKVMDIMKSSDPILPKPSKLGESDSFMNCNSPIRRESLDDEYLGIGKLSEDMTEIFKTPSFLKIAHKSQKHDLSASKSSPAIDIFSLDTQCQAADLEDSQISKFTKENLNKSDNIYSLSPHCVYYRTPNEQNVFSLKTQCEVGAQTNRKVISAIDYDLNDSGTFDFVKKGKSEHSELREEQQFSPDIFSLPTQCPSKLDECNAISSADGESLNFKNKISTESRRSLFSFNDLSESSGKTELNKDNQIGLIESERIQNGGIEKFLNDGEDEELCKLMAINSPKISASKSDLKNSGAFKSLLDAETEIYDISTQFLEDAKSLSRSSMADKTDNQGKGMTEFTVNVDSRAKDNEDAKTETNLRLENQISTKFLDETFGGCDVKKGKISEDDIATQIFSFSNHQIGNKEKNIEIAVSSENNGKPISGDHHDVIDIIDDVNPDRIYSVLESSDSGDETDCELEIKLLNQSVQTGRMKKENVILDPVKAVLGQTECPDDRTGEKISRVRTSSESSDKTVSDLDVLDCGSALKTSPHCDEDFIGTQMFPGLRPQSSSSDKTVSDLDILETQQNCEDFIATQVFPEMDARKRDGSLGTPKNHVATSEIGINGMVNDVASSDKNGGSIIEAVGSPEQFATPVICHLQNETVDEDERSEPSPSMLPGDSVSSVSMAVEILYAGCLKTASADTKTTAKLDESDDDRSLKNSENEYQTSAYKSEQFKKKSRRCLEFASSAKEGLQKSTEKPLPTIALRKSAKKITHYYESLKKNETNSSPLKRTREDSSGIPKKVVKKQADARERTQTTVCSTPNNPKLRNRTEAVLKTPTKSPEIFEAKSSPSRLISEVDLGNIICVKSVGKSGNKKRYEVKSSLQLVQEETLKRSLRPRKSNPIVGSERKRRTRSSEKRKIVFTGFESDSQNRIISKLGGEKVNDLKDGHVLVTDRVRRTVKFLSAVATGIPIVSPKWLTSSEKANAFLDPWSFLLDDKAAEDRWKFNLKSTLAKSKKRKMLKGYSVHATESTRPPVPEILDIVICCGGTPLISSPEVWPEKSILLTCIEDRKWWPPTKQQHVKIVHYEFLLSGVLRHSIDFKTYELR